MRQEIFTRPANDPMIHDDLTMLRIWFEARVQRVGIRAVAEKWKVHFSTVSRICTRCEAQFSKGELVELCRAHLAEAAGC